MRDKAHTGTYEIEHQNMLELIFGLIIGAIIGAIIGILLQKSKGTGHEQVLEGQVANLQGQLSAAQSAAAKQLKQAQEDAQREQKQLTARYEELLQQVKRSHQRELNTLREGHSEQITALEKRMEAEQNHARQLREESNRQWAQRLDTLREEMRKNAAEQLAAKQRDLQEGNRQQMDELLQPIKEQFADFKRSVEESRAQNEVNKKDLQNTFANTMRLFEQQQQQAVSLLKEQTERIGSDAANLTRALKGDSKQQGDWGEMVLATLLENSGLRKDEEYFLQEQTKDDEGRSFRPDVIVRFPEGRSVVIDSKVSLTAYANAVACDDDAQRERLLREHVLSVRRHVDELAEKDYSKIVDDAIGFVLMFIPNESGYIAAMRQQPDLGRYAYAKHIVIISPSNLLMALQLAYNLWQYDRQNKNVEKIVRSAADLYDKVAGFEDTFSGVGDLIVRLSSAFDKAKSQLYDGKGNVMRRIEALKSLGVTPKKRIKNLDDSALEASSEEEMEQEK